MRKQWKCCGEWIDVLYRSHGRKLSPEERRAVEERMRKEGKL